MSWNGAGVFNRLFNWVNDKNAAINITASRMDADTNDITSNGLGNCITRDGQGQPTANLPMANFRHTTVGDGVARADYPSMGQVQDGKINWVAAAGTGDAIAATYVPALTALVDGQFCFVRAGAANTITTPTFAPNGLTARTITKIGGTALLAGDINGAGHELILRYNLANTRWELYNPAGATFGAATFNGLATFNAGASLVSADAGAAVGPTLDLYRDSATPAASDIIGSVDFNGRDSATNKQLYARVLTVIDDTTSTSEDAHIAMQAVVAGTLTTVIFSAGANLQMPGNLTVVGTITAPTPTVQRFTSGAAATFTPTAGMVRIKVRMLGGGGGGGAQVTNAGTAGNTTTFDTWTAAGGSSGPSGTASTTGGAGGTGGTDGTGTLVVRVPGGRGDASALLSSLKGNGGTSALGGGGGRAIDTGAGQNAPTNSGGGGGGGGTNGAGNAGGGGGAGEYVEFWMTAAQVGASKTYTVGTAANGGAAGTQAGGNGAAGVLIIEEFYS